MAGKIPLSGSEIFNCRMLSQEYQTGRGFMSSHTLLKVTSKVCENIYLLHGSLFSCEIHFPKSIYRGVDYLLTNLYIVRHAHSTYTSDELGRPLSERGFTDANTVTELLKKENIELIFSSPYKRAIQTVEGIAKYVNKEIELVEDFKERILSEKPLEDFQAVITIVWTDYEFSWKGGESNRTAQKRGVNATLQLLENYSGKNIVIGTHGNLMVLIMNYFDSKYGFEFWQNLEMPDIYKLSFADKSLIQVNRIWK